MSEAVPHFTCQQIVELVTDYLEGALSPSDIERFEEHLRVCDGCAYYVDQIRVTIDAVGRVEEEDVPAEIRDGLVAAFRDFKRTG
jgi:predicted anti-sigma-YlaC factor YlaD